PVHFAAFADHLFAGNGNVILALASDHAGGATDASVQVNRHAPLVHRVGFHFIQWIWIKRPWPARVVSRAGRCFEVHGFGESFVFAVLLEVRLAHDGTTFHRPMALRGG